jgi:hypothetical protein
MAESKEYCPSCYSKVVECIDLKCALRRKGLELRFPYEEYMYQFPQAEGQTLTPEILLSGVRLTNINIVYFNSVRSLPLSRLIECTNLVKLSISCDKFPESSYGFKKLKILEVTAVNDKRGANFRKYLKTKHDIEHLSLSFNNRSNKVMDALAKNTWIKSLSVFGQDKVDIISLVNMIRKNKSLRVLNLNTSWDKMDHLIFTAVGESNIAHLKIDYGKSDLSVPDIIYLLRDNQSLITLSSFSFDMKHITMGDNELMLSRLLRNRKIYMKKCLIEFILSTDLSMAFTMIISEWLFCYFVDMTPNIFQFLEQTIGQIYGSIDRIIEKNNTRSSMS